MSLFLATVLAFSLAPAAPDDVAPPWLTFDVLNPEAAGRHRILHLEDLLGPKTAIPDLPNVRAILVFSAIGTECRPTSGWCADVAPLAKELTAQGALVIAVLLDPAEALPRAKKELASASHPFVVVSDAHGITRRALGLSRPGELLMVGSTGRITRLGTAGEGAAELREKLDDVKRAVLQALKKDKEDDR